MSNEQDENVARLVVRIPMIGGMFGFIEICNLPVEEVVCRWFFTLRSLADVRFVREKSQRIFSANEGRYFSHDSKPSGENINSCFPREC